MCRVSWFGYRVDAELTCWGSRGDEVGVWICRIWRIFMCSDFLTASDIRFPSNADISLLSSLFHVCASEAKLAKESFAKR